MTCIRFIFMYVFHSEWAQERDFRFIFLFIFLRRRSVCRGSLAHWPHGRRCVRIIAACTIQPFFNNLQITKIIRILRIGILRRTDGVCDLKQQRYRFYAKLVNHAKYIVPLCGSNLSHRQGAAAEWIFGIHEICVSMINAQAFAAANRYTSGVDSGLRSIECDQ